MSRKERDIGVRFEREVAKLLGTRRHLRADFSESAADIITPNLVIEAKYRKSLACEGWLQQVEAHAEPGKYSVVLCRQHGGQAIAIMRATDFLELISEDGND